MTAPTEFEWDEVKAVSNEAKHAIPFSVAIGVFDDDNRLVIDAARTTAKRALRWSAEFKSVCSRSCSP